jgi:hypothetical protein
MDGDFNAVTWNGGMAALNQRLCVLRPRSTLDRRFLSYFVPIPLSSINDITFFTTVKHLSSLDLMNEWLPLPPVAIQRAVADYLDAVTARMDALIDKKRRMIELLEDAAVTVIEEAMCTDQSAPTPLRRLLLEPPRYGASEAGVRGDLDWPRYIRITDLNADGTLRDADIRRLPGSVAGANQPHREGPVVLEGFSFHLTACSTPERSAPVPSRHAWSAERARYFDFALLGLPGNGRRGCTDGLSSPAGCQYATVDRTARGTSITKLSSAVRRLGGNHRGALLRVRTESWLQFISSVPAQQH